MKLKNLSKAFVCFLFPFLCYSNVRPSHAINARSKSYFISPNESNVNKLWVSDGTPSGTKEVYPNSSTMPSFSVTPTTETRNLMIGLDNKAIFKAKSSAAGEELWISDGTAAGTFMLKDINSGASGSNIQNFVKLGNKVVFVADDGIHHQELWITDGTTSGTTLIKDIGSGYSMFSPFDDWKVLNNKLYFGRQHSLIWPELWVTDGTSSGTKNITTETGNGIFYPNHFMADGNKVFFLGVDGLNTKYVYVTDDTPAGTISIATYFLSTVFQGQVLNNKLLFRHPHPDSGSEMWISDGTVNGTKKLQNAGQTNRIINVTSFYKHQNQVYFTANNQDWGGDLWKSDGTEANTSRVQTGMPYDWVYQPVRSTASGPQAVSIGANFFFEGNYYQPNSTELWKSNGTHAGTSKIKTFNGTDLTLSLSSANIFGSKFHFTVTDNSDNSTAWISDGTESGTLKIEEIQPSLNLSSVQILTHSSSDVFFTANINGNGFELLKTNGVSVTVLTGSCPETISVTSPSVSSATHKASSNIIANSSISSPAKVTYQAGNHVVLNPGFEARTGSVFTAKIAGCLE
jgi:ELWxxDGT repeat protein